MATYTDFIPDPAAAARVVATLTDYCDENGDEELPSVLATAAEHLDLRDVFKHRRELCRDDGIFYQAATNDCVPLFRLRLEIVGDDQWLPEHIVAVMSEAATHDAGDTIAYLQAYADAAVLHAANALHRAVRRDAFAALQACLSYPGLDLERTDSGHTPLSLAVSKRFPTARSVELLLEAGAQLTPDIVTCACTNFWMDYSDPILDHLLAASPELDATDCKGVTALQCAIISGYTNGVERLIAAGASCLVPSRRKLKRFGMSFPRGSTAQEVSEIVMANTDEDNIDACRVRHDRVVAATARQLAHRDAPE